eukprot:9209373-Pyramimonas_sp.AAC.1
MKIRRRIGSFVRCAVSIKTCGSSSSNAITHAHHRTGTAAPEIEGVNKHPLDFFVSDGDLNLHTGLDVDGGDLLHHVGRGVQIDQALVNAHLEAIPGVGTLTARRLAGGNGELLRGHAHGSLHLRYILFGELSTRMGSPQTLNMELGAR